MSCHAIGRTNQFTQILALAFGTAEVITTDIPSPYNFHTAPTGSDSSDCVNVNRTVPILTVRLARLEVGRSIARFRTLAAGCDPNRCNPINDVPDVIGIAHIPLLEVFLCSSSISYFIKIADLYCRCTQADNRKRELRRPLRYRD